MSTLLTDRCGNQPAPHDARERRRSHHHRRQPDTAPYGLSGCAGKPRSTRIFLRAGMTANALGVQQRRQRDRVSSCRRGDVVDRLAGSMGCPRQHKQPRQQPALSHRRLRGTGGGRAAPSGGPGREHHDLRGMARRDDCRRRLRSAGAAGGVCGRHARSAGRGRRDGARPTDRRGAGHRANRRWRSGGGCETVSLTGATVDGTQIAVQAFGRHGATRTTFRASALTAGATIAVADGADGAVVTLTAAGSEQIAPERRATGARPTTRVRVIRRARRLATVRLRATGGPRARRAAP